MDDLIRNRLVFVACQQVAHDFAPLSMAAMALFMVSMTSRNSRLSSLLSGCGEAWWPSLNAA